MWWKQKGIYTSNIRKKNGQLQKQQKTTSTYNFQEIISKKLPTKKNEERWEICCSCFSFVLGIEFNSVKSESKNKTTKII